MSFSQDLRASVLQAAMQGKLTEQLETDSIAFGDKSLIDEFYFDLPNKWNVVRYGDLCQNRMGKTLSQKDVSMGGSIPVYSATQEDKPFGYMKDVELKLHKNDFVIPARGNSIGWVTLIKDDVATCTQTTICSQNIKNIDIDFLYYCTKAFKQQWFKYNGSAIPQITVAQVNANLVPLPPIEEQKRIVRRVEEIMKHIDELEAIEEELKKLKEAFPADMKAAVLQAAMQGKLTEQLETDSSVDELLENIKAEREKLVKEGKNKKGTVQNTNFIQFEDIPFDIPSSWKWVKLGEIISNQSGLSYNKESLSKQADNMIRILRGGNISDGKYCFKSDDIMIDDSFVKPELLLNKNVIITPAVTSLEHIGKMARIEQTYTNVVVGGFVLMLTPYLNNDVLSQFLLLAFSAPFFRDKCRNITNKSGQAFYNLSRQKLMELTVPLPPLEEQQRMVDKLETILPLIEDI